MPGARVKVRFAGQDVDGYVVARAAATEHTGRLAPLRRVVSAEPVLTPEVAALTADVAERYAGTRSDVLRLAVPRPARDHREGALAPGAGAARPSTPPRPRPPGPATSPADAFLRHLAEGGSPRAVWARRPGHRLAARCSPTPPRRRTPPGAAPWSASPTARTSPGSTAR